MTVSSIKINVELNEENIIRFFQELKKFEDSEQWLDKKIENIKNNQNQFGACYQKFKKIQNKVEESHKEQFKILKNVEGNHEKVKKNQKKIEKNQKKENERLNKIFEKINFCDNQMKDDGNQIREFIEDDETIQLLNKLRPFKREGYKVYLDCCGIIKILKNIFKI